MTRTLMLAATLVAGTLAQGTAQAQIAGSTTVVVSLSEQTEIARGWSVKRALLGKAIFNEAGEKVGQVEDLIISPDKNLSYLIVSAGGFLGIGRHDVAIAVSRIEDRRGKLVMPGATKDVIKSMPQFEYAGDTAQRDQFVAGMEREIKKANRKIAELEKKAGVAKADAKASLDEKVAALRTDLSTAEAKLTDLKNAEANRWKEFQDDARSAAARLRKSIDDL